MAPTKKATLTQPNKEAAIFLLDVSKSMIEKKITSNTKNGLSRLTCAKSVLESMICKLLIGSKSNEGLVFLLGTKGFENHLDDKIINKKSNDEVFDDASALCYEFVSKPDLSLLREVNSIDGTEKIESSRVSADIFKGLILAADALYERTHGRRYRRNITLLTDAESPVERSSFDFFKHLLPELENLQCSLNVFCFGESTIKSNSTKSQNEQMLQKLVSGLRGSYVSIHDLEKVYSISKGAFSGGQRMATKRKMVLHIAPELSIEIRSSLQLSKASSLPSLKRELVLMDDDKINPLVNSLGEEEKGEITENTVYVDAEDPTKKLGSKQKCKAFLYGNQIFPLGEMDFKGLKMLSDPCITILRYEPENTIPLHFIIGPPYVITPDNDSIRAQQALSALVQALKELKQLAVCSMVKTKNADPVMGVLFPILEQHQHYLLFQQMPFSDDVKPLNLSSLPTVSDECVSVCDDLIDSLMILDKHTLCNSDIPNPLIYNFYKSLLNRVVGDPSFPPGRNYLKNPDPMSTPENVLDSAKDEIEKFWNTFELKKVKQPDSKEANRSDIIFAKS